MKGALTPGISAHCCDREMIPGDERLWLAPQPTIVRPRCGTGQGTPRFLILTRLAGALLAACFVLAAAAQARATLLNELVAVFLDAYNGEPGGPGQGAFGQLGSGIVTPSGVTVTGAFTKITILPTSITLAFAPPSGIFAVNETFGAATFAGFIITVGPGPPPLPLLFPNVISVNGGSVENFATRTRQAPFASFGLPPFAPPAGINNLFSGELTVNFEGLTEGQTQFGNAPVVITLAGGVPPQIPEPSAAALFGGALLMLGIAVRRKRCAAERPRDQ